MIGSIPLLLLSHQKILTPQNCATFESIASSTSLKIRHLALQISARNTLATSSRCLLTINQKSNAKRSYPVTSISAHGSTLECNKYYSSHSGSTCQILDIPSSEEGFGLGFILLPFCFCDDRGKLAMSYSTTDRGIRRSTGIIFVDSVKSISLSMSRGFFASGTVIRLYAVDEDYLIDDIYLPDGGQIQFPSIDGHHGSLFMLGSARSTAAGFNYAQTHQGDRMYHHFNEDDSQSYRYQRITGEGSREWPWIAGLNSLSRKIYRKLIMLIEVHFKTSSKPFLCIQDQSGSEKRFAWVPNDESEEGLFGCHLVFYPEYSNTDFWRSWISFHGAVDGVWNPVASEAGYWEKRDAIKSVRIYPRGGPSANGVDCSPGSSESLYRCKGIINRFVVPDCNTTNFSFKCALDGFNLNVLLVGRSQSLTETDNLLIAFNNDYDDKSYSIQTMSGGNSLHYGSRKSGSAIGHLPGLMTSESIYGSILITIACHGYGDRYKKMLGVCAGSDGVISLIGGSWNAYSPIDSVAFRLESGKSFASGLIIQAWNS
jgi:hypothetical protein